VDVGPLRPGSAVPLGAWWDGRGTNFAVFSAPASQVWLCLFDEGGREQRLPLPEVDAFVWHGYAPGDDPEVLALRARMARNLLATAVLAQGVPMVLYGDECGRTQGGNSNPYDVDGPETWMPWGGDQDADLLAFARRLIALRRAHPAFRRRRLIPVGGGVSYFRPDGRPMADGELDQGGPCAAAIFLDGTASSELGTDGTPLRDTHSFLLVLNAGWDPVDFAVPAAQPSAWRVELATEAADGDPGVAELPLRRPGRSLLVLSRPEPVRP
jgi:isoamylase